MVGRFLVSNSIILIINFYNCYEYFIFLSNSIAFYVIYNPSSQSLNFIIKSDFFKILIYNIVNPRA